MRRYTLMLTALALAMLLMVGLTWAEETKTSQKTMTSTAVGSDHKCIAEKVCAKAEGLPAIDAGQHCAGAKGCPGSGSCQNSPDGRMMMGGGPASVMMEMHQGMMGESGWSGRDRGHRMGRRSGRHGGPDHFLHRAEKLELTEQQIEALKALKWDHEKSTIEMRAQIETAHVDLKQLLDQEKLDFGKIKAKVSQMADLRKKMELARWTLVEKSHDLLTAEQLEKAKTLRKQGSGSMKEGRRQMIKKMIIEEDED